MSEEAPMMHKVAAGRSNANTSIWASDTASYRSIFLAAGDITPTQVLSRHSQNKDTTSPNCPPDSKRLGAAIIQYPLYRSLSQGTTREDVS